MTHDEIILAHQQSLKKQIGRRYRNTYVYVLRDPQGDVFYVGQTRQNPPKARYYDHLEETLKAVESKKYLTKKQMRIIDIVRADGEPIFEIVESNALWNMSEYIWFTVFTHHGVKLTNNPKTFR